MPWPRPSRDAVIELEVFGTPRLAVAFEERAIDDEAGELAQLLAAISIRTEFGDARRRVLLDRTWTLAFALERLDVALAAATLLQALTPPGGFYEPVAPMMISRTRARLLP